jgi:4-hydroxy-2-oxoheptanedioate aldolase
VQIESAAAVDQASAIARASGVDVLFVGPTDLTHSMGIPGRFDEPRYGAAIEGVARDCVSCWEGRRDSRSVP